jgi:multicomponent Na+:H+ antiporter subunit C
MSANYGLLIVIGALTACGVYMILERRVSRMLLGTILFGNALNLLLLTVGGHSGAPPILGRHGDADAHMTDPLAQAMILTAIVITMGVAAFVLALGYRSFTQTRRDNLENDPEDARVSANRAGPGPVDADEDEDEHDDDTDEDENDHDDAPEEAGR